jgi:hypothetical protein
MIQFAPRWRWVWLQLNARHTHAAAIQCRISDPLPQLLVMAQGATNLDELISIPSDLPLLRTLQKELKPTDDVEGHADAARDRQAARGHAQSQPRRGSGDGLLASR